MGFKIRSADVDVYLMRDIGWRVKFMIDAESGDRDDLEVVSAHFIFPVKDPRKTPDEIKRETFETVKSMVKEFAAIIDKSTFDTLTQKD